MKGPKTGSKWRRPNARGRGFVVVKPEETRHVIDRTLGGGVIFISGRATRFANKQGCTLNQWLEWQADAKEVSK